MKRTVVFLFGLALTSMIWMSMRPAEISSNISNSKYFQEDTTFDQAAAIAELKEQLGNRGDEAAEIVYKNIEALKGFPAKRVLAIMEYGFSASLGVNCTHCHDPEDWSSEAKLTKQIARDMWTMVGKINRELLTEIPNLSSEMAFVNCTTCHQGEVIPVTSLE